MTVYIPERRDAMSVDDTHAVMHKETLDRLPEYSTSLPTGTTPGKLWKRNTNFDGTLGALPVWWMGEYGAILDGKQIEVKWREILVIE